MSAFGVSADIMGKMHADDMNLVREFAENGSEAAFASLVNRYVNLVYSAALRQLGSTHEAEEVTQAVFIILAKKAGSLRRGTILSGWLYQAAQLTAANFRRTTIRRQRREQEAFMQFSEQSQPDVYWHRLAPLLEEAMSCLGQKERDALVMRFFENCTVREVAVALGLREDAAQKRVNRATEKLRGYFVRRGIQVSTATLLASIGTHAVHAAPVDLANTISAVTIAKGAAASTSTLTLVKGTLKLMAWTKAKTAMVIGVGILLAAGTAAITVKEVQNYRNDNYPWQVENPTPDMLNTFPRLVKIVPTKFPNSIRSTQVTLGTSSLGIGVQIQSILRMAYNGDAAYGAAFYDPNKRLRMLLLTKIPSGKYDYIANFRPHNLEEFRQEGERLSSGNVEELQNILEKQFGLVGRRETIVTNVLLLEIRYPNAPGLEPVTAENQAPLTQKTGEISFQDHGCRILAGALENDFRMPVLDETGLTNRYYYDLRWAPSHVQSQNQLNLKQALFDQLGLELVPTNMPIQMLVVEKTK